MKINDWLLSHYKKRFGDDIIVLDHDEGPTWNDGGYWNSTIVQRGNEIFKIYMHSDYRSDDLEVIKLKATTKTIYVPV